MQVRQEAALGLVVRVGNLVPDHRPFAGDLADPGHGFPLSKASKGRGLYPLTPTAGKVTPSDQAALGQRDMAAAAHDDMVEQPDLDERQGLGELQGNAAIGLARLRHPRGMIVAEDHGGRVVGEGALDDLARIDGCAVDRAAEHSSYRISR